MKTFKTIVFVYLLIFISAIISITAYINFSDSDIGILLKFLNYMNLFFYCSIIGLVFLLIVFYQNFRLEKSTVKLNLKHEQEINQFKAKLYDKKESESSSVPKEDVATQSDKKASSANQESDSAKPDDESTQS